MQAMNTASKEKIPISSARRPWALCTEHVQLIIEELVFSNGKWVVRAFHFSRGGGDHRGGITGFETQV
jgi:hypothetical protein